MLKPLLGKNVRLPAEWEPQSGVLLTWPEDKGDWEGLIHRVEPGLTAMAAEISRRERLVVACADTSYVSALLEHAGARMANTRIYPVPSNDVWARDHGPITVSVADEIVLLDFTFNGWGLKYRADLDNQISRRLAHHGAFGKTQLQTIGLVLEGGSIESDGQGTILTTTQCLLSPNRNPHLSQEALENELRRWLGAERVLWLHHGHLVGDDTDAHVDTLARFCAPDVIAYVSTKDECPHAEGLREMESELQGLRTADGRPYTLVPLPVPAPLRNEVGETLPASYANFLVINDAVLVPSYGDRCDPQALEIIQGLFPDRDAVPVDATGLVLQYGALHCAAMQFPEGVIS